MIFNNKSLIILFVLIIPFLTYTQNEYTLSGHIIDSENGETLIGSNIYIVESKKGTSSNSYGFFSIDLNKGLNTVLCSYIGYKADTAYINITSDSIYNFQLIPINNIIEEVILSSEESTVKSVQSSVINLPIKQLKNIPALLGEKDVLKSIQLLPGVQSGSEGTSGFYVRGGGPDQNLILLDGVNIYHASHLLGFFSVFNDDAIKNIKLTKGGFPARYGGRLSSILEIDMKDGNMKDWQAEGGIGIISGKMTIQGPIKKDTTSIIISVRRTWLDLLIKPIVEELENRIDFDGNGNYYFYDFNLKINHILSDYNRVYFSFYTGKDSFFGSLENEDDESNLEDSDGLLYNRTLNTKTEFGLIWQNITAAIRWNHIINPKIFTNTTITYSRYNFDNRITTNSEIINNYSNQDQEIILGESDYLYRSGIEDIGIKIDGDYNLNTKHNIKFGLSYIKHNFFPGYMDFYSDYSWYQADTTITFSDNIKPDNAFIYIEDTYKINNQTTANIGMHYGLFYVNKKLYPSLQPRISIRYLINENSSLKLSYAKMQQNIHLLTNSSFGLPNDMWVPATDNVRPQQSKQFVLGYNRQLYDKKYKLSIEYYNKELEDLITFSEGTNILGTNFTAWEEKIETDGIGKSRGLELFLEKKTGKATGWIGYTLSKSTRQFDAINLGNEYTYKFDRRHDLSIVCSYKIRKGLNFNLTWVYGSGNAITLPQAQYLLVMDNEFEQFFDYGEKNGFRLPAYHRLDIGCVMSKTKKWGERTWSMSIYNLYNRKNPFFIYLDTEIENGNEVRRAKQISLFPIMPSIRYSFKFK